MDEGTGYTENGDLMKVKSLYHELVFEIYGRRWKGRGNFSKWMASLKRSMKEFK